jgi:hypothetical protein
VKTPALDPHASALDDALRALERSLNDSRAYWDDQARHAFDRRFADPVVTGGRRVANQLMQLTQDLAAAARVLEGLG